jgi:hypothetical protein
MNDTKLKHQLTEAAKAARYLSQSGRGVRGFADHHIEAFVTAVLPTVRQLRAEVLAAYGERIDLFMENIGNYSDEFGKKRPFKTWDRDDWEAAALRLLTDVQDALDELQPAASDLEALLREAELKSLYWCRQNLDTYDHGEGIPYAAVALRHKMDMRIAELEKARASEGASK